MILLSNPIRFFFYDWRKFRKKCVNMIDTMWCRHFFYVWTFQTKGLKNMISHKMTTGKNFRIFAWLCFSFFFFFLPCIVHKQNIVLTVTSFCSLFFLTNALSESLKIACLTLNQYLRKVIFNEWMFTVSLSCWICGFTLYFRDMKSSWWPLKSFSRRQDCWATCRFAWMVS